MNILYGVIKESYFLLNKMSPFLLFGFIFAGIVHIFLKEGTISKQLGKNNFSSVIKASLFGIPLPLCSCGVIPAALSLKKEGASKGSILAFLISTPTTGIDSILATYSLLGGFFTIYRIITCFIAGLFSGIVANIFFKNENTMNSEPGENSTCKACHSHDHSTSSHGALDKVKGAFKYAFVDLIGDVGIWLLAGIFIGGAISYFVPEGFIEKYLGSVWQSMFVMLLVGIPMYVCASGSLPIVASLMLKGLNPGAAFVFLLAGPATNSAALAVITRELGIKATVVFLSTIIISSLSMGFILDYIWKIFNIDLTKHLMDHSSVIPKEIELIASTILIISIVINIIKGRKMEH